MGVLLSATGGIGEALETHKKALAIRQQLADANPTDNEYQIALTASLDNIGLLLNATGQKFDALESHKKGSGDPAEGRWTRTRLLTEYQKRAWPKP